MNTSPSQYAIIFAWLLCAMIMLNTCMCSSKIRCNEKDKEGLLNFKQGVKDPSGKLSSWSIEQDCCDWIGVKCDNITSRVNELSLSCSTTLPTYTDKADKSRCLTGSIHLSLLQFQSLRHLDLSNNNFLAIQFDSQNGHNLSVAASPHQCCVNSSVLDHLDLSGNQALAIDNLQWLSHLPSLKFIDFTGINLHKETNWLQSVTLLPSLSELYLVDCQLRNLSPSLQYANFTTLETLDLSGNEFDSEFPKWLFNLSDISEIHLTKCFLRGELPKALLNLRQLEYLFLDDNHLNGPIPDWLGQFEHLQYLDLDANKFSGSIPANLGNLSSLVNLAVGLNQLTGVVSERNFAKLSKLKYLSIYSSPPLIFEFDSHWIPPFQLEQFNFGFAGSTLPVWLYTQRSLDFLAIYYSSFEAKGEFWNFASRITLLLLKGNSIDGNMSKVLLNSTYIVLSSNDLKGSLPRLSSNVAVVVISNNSLSGSISPLLCDHKMLLNGKSNLVYLDISDNHLSGGLTNCWESWKSLVHINLGSNNLTGKIPPSMGLLSNLTTLHLHENNLYGEIPPSLQSCRSLLIFNVRENNFSGNIPNWIPQTAMALQLRSNQFSGNIPPQICQMSSLIILDFADNKISGHIPNCLDNITAIISNNASRSKLTFYINFPDNYYYLGDSLELVTKGQGSEYGENLHFMTLIDLSNNHLFGTIPPQMFSLIGLHSLNLSHNKLMGSIPNEIAIMCNMESLDFSTNQLWGEIPQGMSNLSFLSYLNLSFNNFTGKIPLGTQLQGFSALSYIGNPNLCGSPLTKNCSSDTKYRETKPTDEDGGESEFLSWFYIGIECGFVTGFLGVCGPIFLNRKWRHAYFNFLYDMRDRLYVMVAVKMNSFR